MTVIVLLAYSNTFDVPFQFDDKPNIVDNPVIKDLKYFTKPSEAKELKEYDAFVSRYIGYLSFALNYRIHGLDVRGYHIVNLAIHIINGLLIYLLVLLTFRTPKLEDSSLKDSSVIIALISALLFVSHPLQTQAVTYILQRFTSLATMFFLGTIVLYVGSRLAREGVGRYLLYGISVVFAVLAMKTKEISFTLPAVVVLYELMFLSGSVKRRLLYVIPFLLALLLIIFSLADIERPFEELISDIGDGAAIQDISRSSYLFTQASVAVTYLRLILFPKNQNLDYDYMLNRLISDPPVYKSMVLLLLVLSAGIYFFYRSRIADNAFRIMAFGIFWFFICLSVESALVSIYPVGEHRAYLPSIGIIITLAIASLMMIEALRIRVLRRALVCLFVLIPVIFCYAAYSRNSIWRSDISLWEDVIRKSPRSVRANFMLGNIYFSRGLSNRAIMQFQKVIVYKPDFTSAYYNLGNIFKAKGLVNSAIHQYESVVWLKPDHAEAHFELGSAYRKKQQTSKAMEHYRTATKYNPNLAEAHFYLAEAYYDLGRPVSALSRYKKAVEANPDHLEARYNIGLIYCKIKEYKKGIDELNKVLSIDPDHKKAKEMLGLCKKQ